MKNHIKITSNYTTEHPFSNIYFRYIYQNKDLNSDGFKEKGSIDVTPYLDKSDGGTGYAPPLMSPKLLIAILVGGIVLFFVFAKLRKILQSTSLNENKPSEATTIEETSTQNKSDKNKNQSLEVKSESLQTQTMEADQKSKFESQLTDSTTNKPIKHKFNWLFWLRRR